MVISTGSEMYKEIKNEVKKIGYVLGLIIGEMIKILMYAWLLIALIPLLTGIFMFDIVLRIFKIDEYYLLLRDFSSWCGLIGEYLKNKKNLGE